LLGLRHLQEVADAPGGAIGGKMSPKEIRQRFRCAAPLLFFDQMVPLGF
jgi:hypothetical protein